MHRYIFFLVTLVAIAQAQKMGFGGCPAVQPKTPFSMTLFQGVWLVYQKDFTYVEGADKCYMGVYKPTATGVNIEKIITAKNSTFLESILANGKYRLNSNVGAFNLEFPNGQVSGLAPYYVIDTDYSKWAVTYICVDYGIIHFDVLYILRRIWDTLKGNTAPFAAIDAQKLDRSQLKIADEGCWQIN